jgi:hypothetical protein
MGCHKEGLLLQAATAAITTIILTANIGAIYREFRIAHREFIQALA